VPLLIVEPKQKLIPSAPDYVIPETAVDTIRTPIIFDFNGRVITPWSARRIGALGYNTVELLSDVALKKNRGRHWLPANGRWLKQLLHGRAETIRKFLPRSYDFSVRVHGAVNVDQQGGQRAFDQILHAALRIGHRGGLVNAQRFPE
jgi:hypothetical protein